MTAQRERFEAWASIPEREWNAWAAWQEAERQMVERCAKKADYYASSSSLARVIADEIHALGADDAGQ